MALLSKSADYTDRDFESWLARVRSLITSVMPEWSDETSATMGNLLVELFCFIGDSLSYYQDNQAREARITTATLRKNLLALAKLLNYVPTGAAASTASVTFTLDAPVPAGRTVTLNPPTNPLPTNAVTVKTADVASPIEFELVSAVTILAGQTSGVGIVEQSKRQGPETFVSTGLPNQELQLAQAPYLDGSASISADNGAYTVVSTFLQSLSTDRHVVVTVDDRDRATMLFGNGINGAIPVGTISTTYKTGGGVSGNVAAGTITVVEGNFIDSTGAPVTVAVTNAQAASGGADRESNEEIKANAPRSILALTRTVARSDFETNAERVPGVERALMMTRVEDNTISENTGKIYVVPTGAGFPTLALKNAVLEQITDNYPHTLTFSPTVVDPIYVDIGVNAVLFLKKGYAAATVKEKIRTALKDFFALTTSIGTKNELIDFGWNLKASNGNPAGEIALSDVFNVVRDVEGVRAIGDGVNDFRLVAYRVTATNDAYTGGSSNATLVQALAHTDVPVNNTDFPRLKATTLGGSVLDVTLVIDGVTYNPGS